MKILTKEEITFYENLNIDNKALCDSPYDVIGLPKLHIVSKDSLLKTFFRFPFQ